MIADMAKKPKTETALDPVPDFDFGVIAAKIASGSPLSEGEAIAYADKEAREASIANGTHPTSKD